MNERTNEFPTQALPVDHLDDVAFSNVIGLLMTIKEIQQQPRQDDPDVLYIDEHGKRYY